MHFPIAGLCTRNNGANTAMVWRRTSKPTPSKLNGISLPRIRETTQVADSLSLWFRLLDESEPGLPPALRPSDENGSDKQNFMHMEK